MAELDAHLSHGFSSAGNSSYFIPNELHSRLGKRENYFISRINRPVSALGALPHFIADFAGETPWVHIDIAATSMLDSTRGWTPAGATGVPTRSLIELAMTLGE